MTEQGDKVSDALERHSRASRASSETYRAVYDQPAPADRPSEEKRCRTCGDLLGSTPCTHDGMRAAAERQKRIGNPGQITEEKLQIYAGREVGHSSRGVDHDAKAFAVEVQRLRAEVVVFLRTNASLRKQLAESRAEVERLTKRCAELYDEERDTWFKSEEQRLKHKDQLAAAWAYIDNPGSAELFAAFDDTRRGNEEKPCPRCNGHMEVKERYQENGEWLSRFIECPRCMGTGTLATPSRGVSCPTCGRYFCGPRVPLCKACGAHYSKVDLSRRPSNYCQGCGFAPEAGQRCHCPPTSESLPPDPEGQPFEALP